jgi:(1->4)-alpha-D-glucan 1-alpha-D-glucosylmutase
MPVVPRSTYRLQLSAGFTLDDAADLTRYLRDLGVDWFYLSPILQAHSGSTHGYDVIDHAAVDADRGGENGLRALSAAAHAAGMGVLVDIVPNHMGVADPRENRWWWDVLRRGRESAYAGWFDIDWAAGGDRVRIPVLGEPLDAAAASGALRVDGGELRYHEHRFPLAEDTGDGPAEAVHSRQHYELMDWRRADTDLNYRRFFGVNDLAGLRVELPEVFDATHALVEAWAREGLIDGVRVDHPDGLADPGGYLDRLAEATGGAYVLVEKILESGELLPPFWATSGTTGYDALADLDRVLVDPRGQQVLDGLDASLRRDGPVAWRELIHDTKRAVADGILQSDVRRLARDSGIGDPLADDAIAELLACLAVYRSYLPYGSEHLDAAVADAGARRPDLAPTIAALEPVLRDRGHPAAIRFQQTSGMVMAKGVEDTAFYRISRLASLTEVGADPDRFALSVDEFHLRQQWRLATLPHSMTTLSTHDTKRGEDTRARISVLAELPADWAAFVGRRRARYTLGDGVLENLLWESIVGSWPRERDALHDYAQKAAREAGSSTTWDNPDRRFEQRVRSLIDAAFDDAEVRDDIERFVARIEQPGWSNALAAKLLQLTGPGVPDVYQGSEVWEFSLVDPDNRRPVDFAERRRMLAALDGAARHPIDATGAAKLLVTSRALRARRDHPEAFERYSPLPARGEAAGHLVAVDRGAAMALATRLPFGLAATGGWRGTTVMLPSGPLRDEITGRIYHGDETDVGHLLEHYPVALLLRVR